MEAEITDLHRQLKKTTDGFTSHKAQASSEQAQSRKDMTERKEELNRMNNDRKLLEMQAPPRPLYGLYCVTTRPPP
jgi:hypothetical protein